MRFIEGLRGNKTGIAAENSATWQVGTVDTPPGSAFRARTPEADARITGEKIKDVMNG